jgi:uncharacterized membrane protein
MRQFVARSSHVQGIAFDVPDCRIAVGTCGVQQVKSVTVAGDSQEAAVDASDLLANPEPVLKDWLIKRNCSVSPRQFVWFFVSLALFSLAVAFMLMAVGAWLVLPFTGIDLLVVAVAFAVYARHAVDYERIRLYPNRLVIEQVSAEQLTQFEFNPRWVRIESGDTPREPVRLVSRGETIMIGRHLAQYRRAQFAGELRLWLSRC